MNQIEVTPATPSDAEGIYQVQREAWIDTYPNAEYGITLEAVQNKFPVQNPENILKKADQISNPEPGVKQWVAKNEEVIVGWIVAKRDDADSQILALYVRPDCQSKGTGTLLMRTTLDWIGPDKPMSLEVAAYNTKAISFYRKWGFELTDEKLPMAADNPPNDIPIPHAKMRRHFA